MANHPGRNRNSVNITLTKTLAVIKGARKTGRDKNQLEVWLEYYRQSFEYGRGLALDAEDPPSSDSEDEPRQRRSSRRLKNAKMTRGQTAVLKLSTEMFYEIFSYLELQELLSLSRTCKRFRSVLLSISTKSLWQRAIRCIKGLPPCPKGLSEPQYASLILSDTCSECSKPVFDKMDVNLRVKLCAECQTLLLEAYQVTQHVNVFVPTTGPFQVSPRGTIVFALKRDVDKLIREAATFKSANPGANLDNWGNARTKAIHKRKEADYELDEFLDETLEVRAEDAQIARDERRQQAEERLLQGVWTSGDMQFSKELQESWDRLVSRKKPIDDQVWAKLCPKLEALLIKNRERKERKARNGRRKERRTLLIELLSDLEHSSQLLAKARIEGSQRDHFETMYRRHDWDPEDIFKLKAPFPTPASAMDLPIIRNLLEKDISGSEMDQDFEKLRGVIVQHITAWRIQVERDLANIWRGENESPSMLDQTKPARPGPLPKVQLKFVKANGETTINIQELSDDLRLLLRADVVFRTQGGGLPIRRCSYPEIVSRPKPARHGHTSCDGLPLGDPWDPTTIAYDEDGSRVARLFLEALQLPNATSAEMRAYGAIFKCRRCQHLAPNTWRGLVSHFATEISRSKVARERIRELGSTVVYNGTHDLDTRGSCLKIIAPDPGEYFPAIREYWIDTTCKLCGSLGIEARYGHPGGSTTTKPCPMLEHLADVHGITNPIMNKHFVDPNQRDSEDVSEDEDENEDEDEGKDEDDDDHDHDCDTDNSYYGPLPTSDELMELANEADICDSDGEYDTDEALAYFRKKMKRRRF